MGIHGSGRLSAGICGWVFPVGSLDLCKERRSVWVGNVGACGGGVGGV